MVQQNTFTNVLPLIALIFAGYRLIPALQQIYAFYSACFVSPSLNATHNDFKTLIQK